MSDKTKSFNPPLAMNEFHTELQKESPEFYEKFLQTKEKQDVFASEQQFLDELKASAPHLYEKLKQSNFKFRLDDKTKEEFARLVKQSEEYLSELNKKDKDSKK